MSDSKGSRKMLPVHSWPGGYPIIYLTPKCEVLCPSCANDKPEGTILNQDINWESIIQCDECSKDIESAYGSDEV